MLKKKRGASIIVEADKAAHDLKIRAGFVPGPVMGMAKKNGETVAPVTAKIERYRLTKEEVRSHLAHGRVKLRSPLQNRRKEGATLDD